MRLDEMMMAGDDGMAATDARLAAARPPSRRPRWLARGAIGVAAVLALAVLALGAFPVGLARGVIERRIADAVGAPVHIGVIERTEWFSFTPDIIVRDLRIAQPVWAGAGDMVRAAEIKARVAVLRLVLGQRGAVQSVRVSGLSAALIRRQDGTANWSRKRDADSGNERSPPGLSSLTITGGRFSLDDRKRALVLSGTLRSDPAQGLALAGTGRFRGTPATVTVRGGAMPGTPGDAPWPFTGTLQSAALAVAAKGTMAGVLNTHDLTMAVTARGRNLKDLDALIEAGLFGSQPIALNASVRHRGRDWFVDRLAGRIGRSPLTGRATILKRDGRTRIDATIHARAFDFDDLADNDDRARAAAKRARIGPRVVPDTHINLSRIGPTDGVIRFSADRLLFAQPSVFRSLSGTLRLDHRDLRIGNLVAGMAAGRLTGSMHVDSRGAVPRLTADLRIEGSTLDQLIGAPDVIRGPVRAWFRLTGRGDTIRAALSKADGRAAIVASSGEIKSVIADVIGQDLGGAVGHALGGGARQVALRCLIADFRARNGVFVPRTLVVDTGTSLGRGQGRIALDGEAISLSFAGQSKGKAMLHLADPIRVAGTLTAPQIYVGTVAAEDQASAGGILKTVAHSIGSALGLRRDPSTPLKPKGQTIDCAALSAQALG